MAHSKRTQASPRLRFREVAGAENIETMSFLLCNAPPPTNPALQCQERGRRCCRYHLVKPHTTFTARRDRPSEPRSQNHQKRSCTYTNRRRLFCSAWRPPSAASEHECDISLRSRMVHVVSTVAAVGFSKARGKPTLSWCCIGLTEDPHTSLSKSSKRMTNVAYTTLPAAKALDIFNMSPIPYFVRESSLPPFPCYPCPSSPRLRFSA